MAVLDVSEPRAAVRPRRRDAAVGQHVAMIRVQTVHTSSLDAVAARELRAFLDEAFSGQFDDDDWDHTLGGVHALVREAGAIVAHGAVVQRRLLHGGRALRTGYVESVAVRADRRRSGYGRAVMEGLDGVIRGAYELGGLSAGEAAGRLYRSLGWKRWQGRTWVLGPNGMEHTVDEGETTYVLPLDAAIDLDGDLVCDWRNGDVW
jgi:aminoglycoside 2'-N-acetyltransferase I